jgi:hypothetical protein
MIIRSTIHEILYPLHATLLDGVLEGLVRRPAATTTAIKKKATVSARLRFLGRAPIDVVPSEFLLFIFLPEQSVLVVC